MAATTTFAYFTTQFFVSPTSHLHHSPSSLTYPFATPHTTSLALSSANSIKLSPLQPTRRISFITFSSNTDGGEIGGDGGSGSGSGSGGGAGGGAGGDNEGDAGERNKAEAIMALVEAGRSLDSIPKDLAASIEAGRIPGSIVQRYIELEKSAVFRWLLQFGGFKERLLGDDLFLTKVAIECGVGIFTKVCALS